MSIEHLKIGEPFFDILYIQNEQEYSLSKRAIFINISECSVQVECQTIGSLQSAIICNTTIKKIERAVLVFDFDKEDQVSFFEKVRGVWNLAYDIRKEERLRGVEHYLSPKEQRDNIRFSLYHSASIPLNVGLHKEHPFCEVSGFREVHTQIVGFGKMQQCKENDISTLYLEEIMGPGATHRPIYDEDGNYPWHQFETITPSVIMAFEILPE